MTTFPVYTLFSFKESILSWHYFDFHYFKHFFEKKFRSTDEYSHCSYSDENIIINKEGKGIMTRCLKSLIASPIIYQNFSNVGFIKNLQSQMK